MSDWNAYQLRVAYAVSHCVGGAASVEHDVRLRGRSGKLRQVDIAVRGPMFGLGDALLVVECKNRERPVDVGAVDGFFGQVDDLGADFALD